MPLIYEVKKGGIVEEYEGQAGDSDRDNIYEPAVAVSSLMAQCFW